jgi:cell wall-associated NlpC family hydrolase
LLCQLKTRQSPTREGRRPAGAWLPFLRHRELHPGDLVFFGLSAAGIHHVGIYAGGGTMIDAPYVGAVVRYDPIDYHYFGAPRL